MVIIVDLQHYMLMCTFDAGAKGNSCFSLRAVWSPGMFNDQFIRIVAVDLQQKHPLCIQQNIATFD